MSIVSTIVLAKYKQRQVFAVRSFPKGCGRLVVLVDDSDPTDGLLKRSESEKTPSEEGAALSDPMDSLGNSDRLEFLDAGKLFVSKIYLLPKRRKVSAVRTFPIGCERNAPHMVASTEKVESEGKGNDSEICVETGTTSVSKNRDVAEQLSGSFERKLEGFDTIEINKNSRYQSGSKAFDEAARNSAGKPASKGSVKHQNDNLKNLKRKISEEPDDQNQEVKSLEVRGDRLIVQALMAAPNCPWRRGRRSNAITSRSAKATTTAVKGRGSSRK